ncbi:hypothetical protein SAMN02799642_02224 [Methylobacterium brachiatum]|nr:hypothetical protein SAMN02799642_02224 [Methylobacterium brachiatum]
MILLDTNVISELWRRDPEPKVLVWTDAQAIEMLYLSVVTIAELRLGLAIMPKGRRRTTYQERLENEVVPAFAGRILAFDLNASEAYAELMARQDARTRDRHGGRLYRRHRRVSEHDGRNAGPQSIRGRRFSND